MVQVSAGYFSSLFGPSRHSERRDVGVLKSQCELFFGRPTRWSGSRCAVLRSMPMISQYGLLRSEELAEGGRFVGS
jgi:hypothetical protein